MKKNVRNIMRITGKAIAAFCITLSILIGLLYLTACIPNTAFRENLLVSAKYLEENEDEFYRIKEGDRRTEIHNYADAITFNIMYSIDGEGLWDELMMSPFYSDLKNEEYPMIRLLRERIEEEKSADTLYDRYWHGMMVLLRPLFCVFTITQIRILLLVILIGLLVILCVKLWQRGLRTFAIGLCVSAVLSGYPMAAMCIEYTPVWLIMLGSSLAALKYYQKRDFAVVLAVISGVCCAFFDFLTTETVAIVIPLAVIVLLKAKEGQLKNFLQEFTELFICGFAWGAAYILTLLTKWILSGLVLGQERISFALSMLLHRQGAESFFVDADRVMNSVEYQQNLVSAGTNEYSQPLTAFLTNLRLFFGLSDSVSLDGMLTGVLLVIGVGGCFIYLFRKKGSEYILPAILFLLGFVPHITQMTDYLH